MLYHPGKYGVPRPNNLNLSENELPIASSVERTMYWLDRVAEQHGWTTFLTDPVIDSNGFIWYRHNGLELERFTPQESGTYNLVGYPISSQETWEQFREILKFAGYHTLQLFDLYGGRTVSLDGAIIAESGLNWKEAISNWITYGKNTGYLLNKPDETSFVNFQDCSHTKYMGRHGRITGADYSQYILPQLGDNRDFGFPFYASRGGYCNSGVSLKNYNSIGYDFKVTENDYGATIYADVLNLATQCQSWTITRETGPESTLGGAGFPVGCKYGATSAFRIVPTVSLSGMPPNGSNAFTPPSSVDNNIAGMEFWWSRPEINETDSFVYAQITENPGISAGALDYITWQLTESGTISSTNIVDRKDRVRFKETNESFGVSASYWQGIAGIVIPLSLSSIAQSYYDVPAIYSRMYIDWLKDTNHYIRSFTGFVPSDTLDIITTEILYGLTNQTNTIYSGIKYDSSSLASNYNNILNIPTWSGTLVTASSIITPIVRTYEPITDDIELVYGFIDFSGSMFTDDCYNLVLDKIENNDYTTLYNFNSTNIGGDNIWPSINGVPIAGPGSHGCGTGNGDNETFLPRSSPAETKYIGSLQSLVNMTPSGNMMFLCLINPHDPIAGLTSLPYPTLSTTHKQRRISHSGTFDLTDYLLYNFPPRYAFKDNLNFSYDSYHYSALGLPSIPGGNSYPDVIKWGTHIKYSSRLFSVGYSGIPAQDTSYGAKKSGEKEYTNLHFANLYHDNHKWM